MFWIELKLFIFVLTRLSIFVYLLNNCIQFYHYCLLNIDILVRPMCLAEIRRRKNVCSPWKIPADTTEIILYRSTTCRSLPCIRWSKCTLHRVVPLNKLLFLVNVQSPNVFIVKTKLHTTLNKWYSNILTKCVLMYDIYLV